MGRHHDGLQFVALEGSRRGLLVSNHEYTDDGLLHPGGMQPWTAEKVAKSQAAHGISVIEIELEAGRWQMVRPSRYARRFTAGTPFAVSGPAAGPASLLGLKLAHEHGWDAPTVAAAAEIPAARAAAASQAQEGAK